MSRNPSILLWVEIELGVGQAATWKLPGLIQAVLPDGRHGVGQGDGGHGGIIQGFESHGGVRAIAPDQVGRHIGRHRQRH